MMEIWPLNLRHLRAVLEIVRLGSVSAAAQAVALTQPAITQALNGLERRFGQTLFDRHADGMTPTQAALALSVRVERALDHIPSPRVTMAQMRALIALAETGSYAGASAASGLSQPSLHRAVRDLSVALRRTLVQRRGRGVGLTDIGLRTARSFRLARAELVAALSELEALKGLETGQIAIGAMPLARARLLPNAVNAFHQRRPDIRLSIIEGSHAELVEPLRDGELDLLIGALRDAAPADLAQIPLFEDSPIILARAGHPITQQADPWAALSDYPWIIAARGTPLRSQWERMFGSLGKQPPPVPIECGSVITIRQILRESDFLTLLSRDQVAVELDAGILSEICAAPGQLKRIIGITTRAGWRPTTGQKAFLETLAAAAELPKSYSA